jgi:hypothetical protein
VALRSPKYVKSSLCIICLICKGLIFRTSANPHNHCHSVLLEGAVAWPCKTAFNVADRYRQIETEVDNLLN